MIFYLIASLCKGKKPVDRLNADALRDLHETTRAEQRSPKNPAKGATLHAFEGVAASLPQQQAMMPPNPSASTDTGCSTLAHAAAFPVHFSPHLFWESLKDKRGFRVTVLLLIMSAVAYINLQDLWERPTAELPAIVQQGIATAPQRAGTFQPAGFAEAPAEGVVARSGKNHASRSVEFFYAHNMKGYYCLNYLKEGCDPNSLLTSPIPSGMENVYEGGVHYAQYCAGCHGDSGMGDGQEAVRLKLPMERLSWVGSGVLDRDAYLFWMVAAGGRDFGGHMPPFKEILAEKQIWQLIFFLKTLH
ncbi:MAG: cytochrome c [Magnetococcales bacterium]|nr:cytochrome c [Magnetococcales bacterium]